MSYIHTIPVHLYDNPLTEDADDLFARIETNKTLGIHDICMSVVTRTHAPVDIDMMEMCVRKFLDEMLYRTCDGYAVNAEYFTVALQVKGTFKGAADRFDSQRHRIIAELQEGVKMRKYIDANATVLVKGMADPTTTITQVKDCTSGSINTLLTAGGAIIITGTKIKLAGSDTVAGVYLERTSDGVVQHFPVQAMVENTPGKLIMILPRTMTAGEQMQLSVRTQYSGSGALLKEPRTVVFNHLLTVAGE